MNTAYTDLEELATKHKASDKLVVLQELSEVKREMASIKEYIANIIERQEIKGSALSAESRLLEIAKVIGREKAKPVINPKQTVMVFTTHLLNA